MQLLLSFVQLTEFLSKVSTLLASVPPYGNFTLRKGRKRNSEGEGPEIMRKRVNQEKVLKKEKEALNHSGGYLRTPY